KSARACRLRMRRRRPACTVAHHTTLEISEHKICFAVSRLPLSQFLSFIEGEKHSRHGYTEQPGRNQNQKPITSTCTSTSTSTTTSTQNVIPGRLSWTWTWTCTCSWTDVSILLGKNLFQKA